MKGLYQVAAKYVGGLSQAGGVSKIDAEALRRDLMRLARRNQAGIWISLAMYVLLFGSHLWAIGSNSGSIEHLERLTLATGITTIGIILLTARLWKEKSRADLMLTILPYLSQRDLRAVLHDILRKPAGADAAARIIAAAPHRNP